MSDFYTKLKSMGSVGDYQKLEAEFQMKKAQAAQQQQLNDIAMQKAQAEIAQPDIKGLASRGLFDYYQGKPLTAEARAALETQAVLEGSNVKYQPDMFGNVRAVSEPNPYQQFLGSSSRPMAAPSAAVTQAQIENPSQEPVFKDMTVADIETAISPNNPGMTLGQKKPSDLSQMAFDPKNAPSLDAEVLNSPYGRKAMFDQQIKLMGDVNNPNTEIGKMQKDEKLGLVPAGSTQALIKEKSRQTRKEDLALQNEEKAAKEAAEQEKTTKNIAQTKVKEAFKILEKSVSGSGRVASAALMLPGKATPADVLSSAYSTLKSNISLDKMMQLKAASPTGSTGFGALNTAELKILTDQISELDPELPYEVQKQNLINIAKVLKLDIPELTGVANTNDVQDLIDRYAD